jgi:hypothetical protein
MILFRQIQLSFTSLTLKGERYEKTFVRIGSPGLGVLFNDSGFGMGASTSCNSGIF